MSIFRAWWWNTDSAAGSSFRGSGFAHTPLAGLAGIEFGWREVDEKRGITVTIEDVLIEKFQSLDREQQNQVLEFLETLKGDVPLDPSSARSLRGLWRRTGSQVDDDIDELRREIWRYCPREDLA